MLALTFVLPGSTQAIDIVLDYTLDDNNLGWFSDSPDGLARRASLDSAASFLSAIITNDDWNAVAVPNEKLTFTDIAASTLNDIDGNSIAGAPEVGEPGFSYTFALTNLSPADFNFDNVVDSADLATWSAGYGVDASGDANGDGFTDGTDLLVWQREFGFGQELLSATSAVPEPSSVLMFSAAIAVGLRRRGSRRGSLR